jgi:hypothetical protein
LEPLLSATFLPLRSATLLIAEPLGTSTASAVGAGFLVTDINEVGAGGLREDGRRFTDVAEIDRPDVEPLQQLGSGGKFHPFHLQPLRPQASFDGALGLEQGQQTGRLLEADAQQLRVVLSRSRFPDSSEGDAGGEAECGLEELAFHLEILDRVEMKMVRG